MKRSAILPLALLLALAGCKSSTHSSPVPDEDSFDTNTLTNYAQFSDDQSHWSIQEGSLVGTGPAMQSVLIRNTQEMTDGYVEAVSSRADDGGLVLRFQDNSNYYLLAFRDDAAPDPRGMYNLALYHKIGSEYREITRGNVAWPRGTSHTVRLEAKGPTFRIYFDGELQLTITPSPAVNDPLPYVGPGRIGVRHFGDDPAWITSIDTFRWYSADRAQ